MAHGDISKTPNSRVGVDSLRELGPSWLRNVVEPLGADVFLFVEDRWNSTAAVLEGLGVDHVKGMMFVRQPREDEIIALFRTSPRMRGVVDFPRWKPGSDVGNGCFPSVLMLYYWMEHVYRLASGYELAHGFQYDRMIFSRPDIEFLYEHAPSALLPSDRLSTMAVSGYHGLPLILFSCPRHLCHTAGLLYSNIMEGTTPPELDDLNYNCHSKKGNEVFWKVFFQTLGVPVSQYLATGCIVCLSTQDSPGEFAWHRGKVKLCPPQKHYKYDSSICLKNAALLRTTGWRPEYVWNLAPGEEGRPVVEYENYDPRHCGQGPCYKHTA